MPFPFKILQISLPITFLSNFLFPNVTNDTFKEKKKKKGKEEEKKRIVNAVVIYFF